MRHKHPEGRAVDVCRFCGRLHTKFARSHCPLCKRPLVATVIFHGMTEEEKAEARG